MTRTRTRTRTLTLVALLAAALPAAAFAFGGHGGHGSCAASAEEAREHAGRMFDRGLDRVDATDAQRTTIDAVLDRAVPQIYAVREEGAALREDARDVLTADTVDAAAAEAIRKDALALVDEGSRLMVGAMVEVASVLTPDQRQELGDLMDRMHEDGPPGERGGPGGPDRGERRGQ
jgi:Spy/CpxP family protein refolding chaperone